ncbi:envelope stress response membrane protein PspB [Vibrio cincinnatiensis]|jgi:phage shock protein B|uniref:Phage shock protein B n=1 Tax=Vibrio cincinnatiensis DSM 19608 TaxID=1123491 RepID=A0A1T4KI98_VIBCI|nr:envelope stress response membrane protein PspB [Vibrio cincinnatiensis]MCG3722005.1 envelope stress response membrane protein PspB [Vibrio cincinnatiensis]MCG3724441.1 envelope stress response membrane protein PspB [Vibrio cincinnatiensis]MCG3731182.1 envelope stress response membrane protein PspB [Vibrio cincinnatiensis]MCG3736351.1 envelope stress response membrane protein PspB [Vibrio cincinnatiensis]MCG3738695.1 envelope stress response membrane protein PspB [Vibrio cincinnatiensis]
MASLFIAGPLVVFLIFVAPLWLLLHYRSKRKAESGLSEEEYQQLQTLSEQAKGLQQRVEILEKILDKEAPTWRGQYESS